MPEEVKGTRSRVQISSRTYLLLAAIFFIASIALFLFVHPVAFLAALVIGIFLLVGAFFSMANERRWLD
jgi:hypothetical protein